MVDTGKVSEIPTIYGRERGCGAREGGEHRINYVEYHFFIPTIKYTIFFYVSYFISINRLRPSQALNIAQNENKILTFIPTWVGMHLYRPQVINFL